VSEARDVLRGVNVQLLVLDIGLEIDGENGLEFLKRVRSEGFKGTVCVHSNRTGLEDLRASLEAGANAVIPKPLSTGQLLGLMRDCLN
jgi:DNA-binding response OmpR family regulator